MPYLQRILHGYWERNCDADLARQIITILLSANPRDTSGIYELRQAACLPGERRRELFYEALMSSRMAHQRA